MTERKRDDHSGPRDFMAGVEVREHVFGHCQLRTDGLVHVQNRPGDHELHHARAYVDYIHGLRLERGRKLRVVVDIRDVRTMPSEVRELYGSDEHAADVVAVALVIDGGVSRVIGNFAMRLVRTRVPQRLFNTIAEAVEWLETVED